MTTLLKVRTSILFATHLVIEDNVIISEKTITLRKVGDDQGDRKITFDKYAVMGSSIIDIKTNEIIKYLPGDLIDIENNTFIKCYAYPLDNAINNPDEIIYIDMDTLAEYSSDKYLKDIKMFTIKRSIERWSFIRLQVIKYYSESRLEYLPSVSLKCAGDVHNAFSRIRTIDNYLIICSDIAAEIVEIIPGLTHYLTQIKYKDSTHSNTYVFKMNLRSVTKPALSFL